MPRRLRIDFVSDISCPWCIIGLRGLEIALERLGDTVEADIHFQPFELNPAMAPEGENIVEHIGRKYGATPEQSAANRANIRERAASVGFTMAMADDARIYNSFDAHRLLHWAEMEGRQAALKHALFDSYFKFAFVRNPWDRAISQIEYLRAQGVPMFQSGEMKTWLNRYCETEKWFLGHDLGACQVDYLQWPEG